MNTPTAMAAPHTPPSPVEDEALVAAKAAARKAAAEARKGLQPWPGRGAHPPFPRRDRRRLAGAVVSGFWPMGDEIDIRPLLHALARARPSDRPAGDAAAGDPLVFRALAARRRHFCPGRFGTSHTDGPVVTPDLLLMPLLAFDRRGPSPRLWRRLL